ncbi:MAG: exosortase/archaeosortase family protein [Acidobacteriota bacterium]|nr:exosortase/archaeosortase family protein [Acidobacteriota bacterium]
MTPLTPSPTDNVNGAPEMVSAAAGHSSDSFRPEVAPWSVAWAPLLLLTALLILLYHGVAVKLVTDWYELPDFSHGFLIPFFAAFLLWDNRRAFLTTPIAPSWAGTILVVLGLFALLLGRLGADLFFQRTSFVILVAGIVWTLLGKPMLSRAKFVLFVILLAIPLPTILFNQITFPLQLLASRFASDLLQLTGVPVLRDGNIIQLPAMPLEVAEACSGIRSLMSLFTVAVIYGYFLERATWRRMVLALSALPIAVTANVARIFGTGLCVQYWDPEKAMGFFHEFSGWLMFLVSLSCLYLVHLAMSGIAGKEGSAA